MVITDDPVQYEVDAEHIAFLETLTNNSVVIPRHPFDLNELETTTLAQLEPFAPDDTYGIKIDLEFLKIPNYFLNNLPEYLKEAGIKMR